MGKHDRVCVIGGGPAGSFTALHLLQLSKLHDLNLEVLIFEPRDFLRPGPGGCNRCAGILSSHSWSNLSELNLSLPDEIIQADLQSYQIHLSQKSLRLERPNPNRRIVSVYRGGGPRIITGTPVASFDHFLLSQAISRGAIHIPHRAREVTWENRPVVHTKLDVYPAEFLVLATGINSKSPLAEQFGYYPPRSAIMAQDEVLRPAGWNSNEVNAYFQRLPGLTFGAIIPKGRYLNISLLGKGFTRDTVEEFIAAQNLTEELQYNSSSSLCGCNPRVAVTASRNYFGDRWVAVGDAAVTRLYKDGIGSAYKTAKSAIASAIEFGISRHAFHKHYAPICRSIAADNTYGSLLYHLWNFVLNSPFLLNTWKGIIESEMSLSISDRKHSNLLWGMLTGDKPYRQLFFDGISPIAMLHLWHGLISRRKGS